MSPALAPSYSIALPTPQRTERRSARRYPLGLTVYYTLLFQKSPARGFGRTIDVSSKGILFEAENFSLGYGKIELALKWPLLLDGCCNLQLIVRGRIVRLDHRKVAVCSEFYEFRTASRSAFERLPCSRRGMYSPPERGRLNVSCITG
jgi:hypothetical protein